MSIDNLRVVYNASKQHIPGLKNYTFEEFQERMASDANKQKLYKTLVINVPELGTYEEFNKRLVTPEKPEYTLSEIIPDNPKQQYYFAPLSPAGQVKTEMESMQRKKMSTADRIQEYYDDIDAELERQGTSLAIEGAKARGAYIEDPTVFEYFTHGFLNEFSMGMDQNVLSQPKTLDKKVAHVLGSFSGMIFPFTKSVQISGQGIRIMAKKSPQAIKNVVKAISKKKAGKIAVGSAEALATNVIGFNVHGQLYTHPPGTTIEQRLEEIKHNSMMGAMFTSGHVLSQLGKLGKAASVPAMFSIGWNMVEPESSTEDRWINALLLTALQVNSLKGQARLEAEMEYRDLVNSAYKPEVGARMVQTAMDIVAQGKIPKRFRPSKEVAEETLPGRVEIELPRKAVEDVSKEKAGDQIQPIEQTEPSGVMRTEVGYPPVQEPIELTKARKNQYISLHIKQKELVDSGISVGDPDFRAMKKSLFGKESMADFTDTELSQYGIELSALKYGAVDLPMMKRPSFTSKLIPDFIKQAQNRGQTKPFKKFVTMIDFGDRIKHNKAGEIMEGFRKLGLHKISKKEAAELADALERGEAPEYRRILDNMYQVAVDAGLKVPGYQENYFPRMMKPEVSKIIHGDLLDLQRTAKKLSKGNIIDDAVLSTIIRKRIQQKGFNLKTVKLLRHLIKTKQAATYVDAYNKLRTFVYNDAFNPFGNLEKPRTLEIPVDFWERDARVVLNRYAMGWAKRVAEATTFGADGKIAMDAVKQIEALDPKESQVAWQMLQSWTGAINRDPTKTFSSGYAKAIELATQFEVLTKIGLGTATIPNITQTFISTLPTAGTYRTAKGFFRLLLPKERSAIRSSGAIMETAARTWAGFETTGAMGKFTQAVLGLHFTPVNKFNNYLAASTAEIYIQDLHRLANKKGLRQKWAKEKLQKYGLDKKTLTEDDVAGFMYRFSTDQQLLKNVLRDPLSSHDPRFRSLWLFKKFGVKQSQLIKDEVLKEVQKGNPMPLLRLAAGGYIGGEFVGWARNKIKTFQSGEEHYRDDEEMWERAAENYAAVGAVGVISDIVTSGLFGDYPFVSTAEFVVSPVMVQTMEKIGDTIYRFGADLKKYDWTDAARRALPNIVRLLGPSGTQVSKRLQTPSQKEGRLRFRKGKARQTILKAFTEGNNEEAFRIYTSWNEHNTNNPIFPEEINTMEVVKYIKRKEKQRVNP